MITQILSKYLFILLAALFGMILIVLRYNDMDSQMTSIPIWSFGLDSRISGATFIAYLGCSIILTAFIILKYGNSIRQYFGWEEPKHKTTHYSNADYSDISGVSVYANLNDKWVLRHVVDEKYLDSLYFNHNIKDDTQLCMGKVSLCIGAPGSGKETLTYLKAAKLKKKVYQITTNKVASDEQLELLINEIPEDSIIVFTGLEQTQTLHSNVAIHQFLNKITNTQTLSTLTLSGVINALDELQVKNRTVIVTLNNQSKVSPELSDVNRYSRIIRVEKLTVPVILEYILERFDISKTLDVNWHPILANELENLVQGCKDTEEMEERLKLKFN